MRMRYGTSPWIHEFAASRRPDHPRFRGERTADVVIVGAGLTGCAAAHACAAAGLQTVVLEASRIGQGSTGRGAGLLTPEPGPAFRDVMAAHGLRSARRVFEVWRRGVLDGSALLRRLKIKCDLEPVESYLIAGRDDEKRLRREYDGRRDADLESAWVTPKQIQKALRLDAAGGMRTREAFTLDPYRACVGLAQAATRRGAEIFERSVVKKVRFTRKDVEIVADGGIIRAGHVVVTTGSASPEFKGLRRHFTRREQYLAMTEPIPAEVRRQLNLSGAIVGDARTPPQRLRWASEDRLLVAGADQNETPARLRETVLVQRTGQLMYELLKMYPAISGLQPVYGWEAAYGETADGLMYIGAHRNYPHHVFALGGGRDSVTGAFVAARIIVRAVQDAADKADDVFGWTR